MYFISKNYKSLYGASGKAKTDFEFALKEIGFVNLGFKQSSIPNSTLGTIKNFFGISWALLRLPYKSVLATQYPVNKFRNYILFVARLKRCKIITLVHDIGHLRKPSRDKEKELRSICNSNVVIVHNPNMKQWFLEQGVKTSLVELGIFDYIAKELPKQNSEIEEKTFFDLVYVGSYSSNKNEYVYDIDDLNADVFNLNLYGPGFDKEKQKKAETESSILYQGFFPSNEIANKVRGDFGLVWDGDSIETCSGRYGEYLQFNNPHKTSLYLSCGLPIIIWEKAALAQFVKENKIGITISNLKNLNNVLKKISFEDYKVMKENVLEFQKKVTSGVFYKESVIKAIDIIKANELQN